MITLHPFSRIFASIFGGFIGSGSMASLFVLNQYIYDNPNNFVTEFLLIFMIFIGSLIANLFTGLFLRMVYVEKYQRMSDALLHTFVLNLFIFLLFFPVYSANIFPIISLGMAHIILSTMATNIIYELFAGEGSYIITGIYASFMTGIILLFTSLLLQDSNFMSVFGFILLPFAWGVMTCSNICIEFLYTLYFTKYKSAILDPKKHFLSF
ncbi:hypothetical protein COB57_00980 [Candidatus Peregrinibacteria bacterium]|nr:MAG: hypothetical protein COB57_00980 [Candidatus Peregrinibacteria bacterium]